MEQGIVTNYKYYEEDGGNKVHFYEITVEEDEKCYYVKSEIGEALAFGTEVSINQSLVYMNNSTFPVIGPFKKTLNIINYQGFVIDCIDSDIGVYNLDNEIFLFGSACLDLPIGVNVTLFNLHLIQITDMNIIFKLFGRTLKKSTHILVYCPAFSSYLEGLENISYDNFIYTKTDFFSLIYTNKWLKDNFKFDFLGFQNLENLASILFSENQSQAQFIGHCERCAFIQNFKEVNSSTKLLSAQDVKDSFHKIKGELQDSNVFSNQVLSKYSWMRNEIVHGIVTRKNSVLFDIVSGDKTVSIYSNESNGFNPPDGLFCLIINAIQIVEIVPKLRTTDSWTTKAYLWISPDTKIWSPSDYFWTSSLSFSCPAGFILSKIVRKYLILKEFDQKQFETTVIHVESGRGPHCFYLNPNEKYYGILSITTSDEREEGILALRYCINEIYFKESNEPRILPSTAILPILSCTLDEDEQTLLQGPLQVRINDLPYLSLIKSLQFFSLKLRFYSILSLSLQLICSKCKSQVEGNRCLVHLEAFSPALILSAVFDAADMDGSSTTVLIDRFSFFETILGTKTAFKTDLINLLKFPGKIKLNSEHFAFSLNLKTSAERKQQPEEVIANLIPRVSRVMTCTFSSNMANSVLKPVNLEYSDPKLEIIKLLKLF